MLCEYVVKRIQSKLRFLESGFLFMQRDVHKNIDVMCPHIGLYGQFWIGCYVY